MFAFGNVNIVPIMANAMSAICSALTILLLFWTITHLARKVCTDKVSERNMGKTMDVIGTGLRGA